MEDRQKRLESKVAALKRAEIWTRRFARIASFFCIVGFGVAAILSTIGIAGDGLEAFLAAENTEIIDNLANAIFLLICWWWMHRVGDAFEAIVEIIDELAETV